MVDGRVDVAAYGGRVVKRDHRLVDADLAAVRRGVESTVEFLRGELGDAWESGMNPDVPERAILDNPYQYTDFKSSATHDA